MTRTGPIGRPIFAPTARTKVVTTARANVKSMPNGDIHVRHREYLFDIDNAVATFNLTTTPINPGIAASFPWLSKIARNYESYRFNRLVFCYETESPSTTAGTVMLAVDYDSSDIAPASKQQLMAYRNSVRSAPWNPCDHRSASEDLNKRKSYFVRSAAIPNNTDQKLYDVGNLFVATQGVGVLTVGEIYVEYDILLMTPEYTANDIVGGSTVGGGTMTAANPLGSVPVPDSANAGFTTSTNSNITFTQLGDYVLTYSFVGTNITAAPATQPLGAGVTLLNATAGVIDAGALNAIVRSEVRVTSLIAATIDITLTATTITASRVDVASVPQNSLA